MFVSEQRGARTYIKMLDYDYIPHYLHSFSPVVQAALHRTNHDTERDYLKQQIPHIRQGKTVFYCIFDGTAGILMGAIEINPSYEQRGQLYSWLHEDFWGTGMYQEALQMVSAIYFNQFKVHFFNAQVDVANKRSLYALLKCGGAHHGFADGAYGKQYKIVMRKK